MLLLGGNSAWVAHARKTHRGKYGEATPLRQPGGGSTPPPYPLRGDRYCRAEKMPAQCRRDAEQETRASMGTGSCWPNCIRSRGWKLKPYRSIAKCCGLAAFAGDFGRRLPGACARSFRPTTRMSETRCIDAVNDRFANRAARPCSRGPADRGGMGERSAGLPCLREHGYGAGCAESLGC